MPHSSGGGSYSGGHSGHSSHSSHGSHSSGGYNGPSRRRRYYYYYRRKHPLGKRCVKKLNESPVDTRIVCIVIALIFATIFIPFLCITIEYHFPAKMESGYSGAIIEDETDLLGDTAELKNTLDIFGEKTGITVALVTVYNDEYDSSLEDYAYNRYLSTFDNEDSWLIVLSCSPDDPADSEQWVWEGMQGDNTDSILTSDLLWDFNLGIQGKLYDCEMGSVGALFSDNISSLSDKAMTVVPDKGLIILTVCFGLGALIPLVITVRSFIIYGIHPQIAQGYKEDN